MSELLRYTGVQATTFQEPGTGCVEPGGEFEVDESRLAGFMRRPDIEHAGECPKPPCRCGQEPQPEAGASRDQDGGTSGGLRSGRRGRSGSPTGRNDVGETAVP